MNQTFPLDPILRRLDRSQKEVDLRPGDHLFVIDANRRKILPKAPLFSFGADIRRLRISRGRSIEEKNLFYRIKSLDTGHWLELTLDYDAWCEQGDEERLALGLGAVEQPSLEIKRRLGEWLEEQVREARERSVDLALSWEDHQKTVETELAERARKAWGLSMSIRLRPRLADKLEPIPVELQDVQVRPSDANRMVMLDASTEIDIDPAQRIRAILAHQAMDRATERVQKAITRQIANDVRMHEMAPPIAEEVEARLIKAINNTLEPYGRRIRYLHLDARFDWPASERVELAHEVWGAVREIEEEILVRHRVILTLENLGKLIRSQVEDAEAWLRERLEQHTRSVLFDKTYLDLLRHSPEGEIKNRVAEEAEAIGYSVQQMTTVPDLEPLEWTDRIDVSCEEKFATNDSRVKAPLELVVHGKIPRNQLTEPKLRKYLHPSPRSKSGKAEEPHKLLVDMEKTVRDVTRRVMHKVEPQRFYMGGFHHPLSEKEKPIHEDLELKIAQALSEQFCVKEVSVLAKPQEGELVERITELTNREQQLDIECASLRSGGENLKFMVRFQICTIGNWQVFCARRSKPVDEELSALRESLAKYIEATLKTLPREELQYRDQRSRLQLGKKLEPVYQKIFNNFGLDIRITELDRELTAGERSIGEELEGRLTTSQGLIQQKNRSALELYAKLTKRKQKILEASGIDDPELEEVETALRSIEEDVLEAYEGTSSSPSVQPLLPGRVDDGIKEPELDEYFKEIVPNRRRQKELHEGTQQTDHDQVPPDEARESPP